MKIKNRHTGKVIFEDKDVDTWAGYDFKGVNLSKANLSEANLYQANLLEANLYQANLSEANLYQANLSEANLPKPL